VNSGPKYSIIIPAFNEAERLPATLDSVLAYLLARLWNAEIIVVNDGSTDETAAVVQRYAAANSAVRSIENGTNRGKGHSIRRGVEEAAGEIVLFIDADNSTPIEDAQKLFHAIAAGADIAVGSRWVDRASQLRRQPLHRRLNGRIYNLLTRALLVQGLKDTQNGFKAYTQHAMKTIFALQRISGWGFDVEALYLAQRFGFVVREVAVDYTYTPEGSKVRPYRDGLRMFAELLLVKWYAVTGAYPRRVDPWRAPRATFPDVSLENDA